MSDYNGKTISWKTTDGVIELALDRAPANEIGLTMLDDLERFAAALPELESKASALIIYSKQKAGFSAGADLLELHSRLQEMGASSAAGGVREFLERIHAVLNRLDASPLTTIAAVHGWCFGGGFELALTCDLIIADKKARFCFPELRLGLIPGFGGIPRLKRDVSNALVRDLLLTGRSISAAKALGASIASQVVGVGEALSVARMTAAHATKFDRASAAAAKRFIKPLATEELRREIEIFCHLFAQPAVKNALTEFARKKREKNPHPYLP